MTRTRTHVYDRFANPYIVCELCHQPVCDASFWNATCGHTAGVLNTCPSWSPVDGCQCTGKNPHRVPRAFN